MVISASGYYGLTLESQLTAVATPGDMESTTVSVMLPTDAYTHLYDTHNFRDDIGANEVAGGSGYVTGGKAIPATPTWLVASPGAGQIAYDSPNPQWAASTITNAEAAVLFWSTGTNTTDNLLMLSDFGAPVSTANGTLTVQVDTNGWMYIDYTA